MLPRFVKDMSGQTFGRLTVIAFVDTKKEPGLKKSRCARWLCKCTCGKEIVKFGTYLRAKHKAAKSCGCISAEHMRRLQPKASRMQWRAPGQSTLKRLHWNYAGNAKRRGLVFDLTFEESVALMSAPCAYCGRSPSGPAPQTLQRGHYNGIDRPDNARGYEKDNVVPCCKICNIAKASMAVAEFLEWVERIYHHQHQ